MPQSRSKLTPEELLAVDPDLRRHLDALGLRTAEEYGAWCARSGFSPRVNKHWHEQSHERYLHFQELIQRRLELTKQQKRKPQQLLERLFAGDLAEADIRQPALQLIHRLLLSVDDLPTRQSFERLILHVHSTSGLVSAQPALPQLGLQAGNTFLEALLALARISSLWVHDLASWRPRSLNVHRQYSSLAAHLVAKYPVPAFLDSAWFRGQTEEARRQQRWYLALAAGQSPRRLDFPIPLTRRMSHFFLQAPKHLLVEAALRWGQVLGLGGNSRLAKAMLGSRIGTSFSNDEFWVTVIRWLIAHPMLDTAQVGPIIDYIYHQKFEPQLVQVGTGTAVAQPLQADFSMPGRTPLSLIGQMREWHAGLRKETRKPDLEWPSSGIGTFELTEGTLASGTLRKWAITELRSRRELFNEGRAMRHCVASYDSSCAMGRSSIWSLALERNHGRQKHVLTIEVSSTRRTICQVRGRANRLPNEKELDIIRRWASQEQLAIDSHLAS